MLLAVGVHSGVHWYDDDTPLKHTYVMEATDYGLQKMNELVNVQEPHLYQIGMTHPCDAYKLHRSRDDPREECESCGNATFRERK
jgi:hypothetical protein